MGFGWMAKAHLGTQIIFWWNICTPTIKLSTARIRPSYRPVPQFKIEIKICRKCARAHFLGSFFFYRGFFQNAHKCGICHADKIIEKGKKQKIKSNAANKFPVWANTATAFRAKALFCPNFIPLRNNIFSNSSNIFQK